MDRRLSTRRRLLRAGAALGLSGLSGLAGCTDLGSGPDPTDAKVTETDTPEGGDTPTATDGGATETTDGTGTSDASREEAVTFRSTADTEVEATLYGAGDCGVAFVPQINMDRESWQPQARQVAERGHVALSIDEDPDNRAASALGAVGYLREDVGVDRIVLVGASSGGEAVVRATARADDGAVQGLVTLSAGGGEDVADGLQGRNLFVVSEDDDDRFVRVAQQLFENAPEPKELKVYEGGAHGQRIFGTDHGDDLRERLFGLVDDACSG